MSEPSKKKARKVVDCPYLDTIDRSVLDFDLPYACSVTLETGPHIYLCLVCGVYFRGRGQSTAAYQHALLMGHHCFFHVTKGKFYCLPDDYEIEDPSLQDIQAAWQPKFTPNELRTVDSASVALARDVQGRKYLPGFCGLQTTQEKTDGIHAVVQALAHVPRLRNYFLLEVADKTSIQRGKKTIHLSPMVLAFGEVVRKLWSSRKLKHHVSPHRLVNEVHKTFREGKQLEAGEFMAWFLHQLHTGLGGSHKKPSIVTECFQGQVQVTSLVKKSKKSEQANDGQQQDDRLGSDDEEDHERKNREQQNGDDVEEEEKTTDTKFLQLTLEIPEKLLFRDEEGGLVIPQEPLVNVLKKFDGSYVLESMKKYRLRSLPQYLILHLKRFTTNKYGTKEKNPTIVAFPVKNFDMSPYVQTKRPSPDQINSMSVKDLRAHLPKSLLLKTIVEKSELQKLVADSFEQKYNLVANIIHESPSEVGREGKVDALEVGSYKCHVHNQKQWYEIQDLHVQETMPQLVGLSESLLLIFEKKEMEA